MSADGVLMLQRKLPKDYDRRFISEEAVYKLTKTTSPTNSITSSVSQKNKDVGVVVDKSILDMKLQKYGINSSEHKLLDHIVIASKLSFKNKEDVFHVKWREIGTDVWLDWFEVSLGRSHEQTIDASK